MEVAAPSTTGESAIWDNRQNSYRDQTGKKTIDQFHKYRLPFNRDTRPYCPWEIIVLFYPLSRKLMENGVYTPGFFQPQPCQLDVGCQGCARTARR
jgi:hypothetical protein